MMLIIHCPNCQVELTVPQEAGARRLKCPKCATRFYPPGVEKPPSKEQGQSRPMSSVMADSADILGPPKKVKVPPSSGTHPTRGHGQPGMPTAPGDLRDLLDIPLAGDSNDLPRGRAADAAALFRDDPPPSRPRRSGAEARRESRQCPECGALVSAGMALCNRCGLDLDSGNRYEVEEYLDEPPPPMPDPGPPAAVIVIGLVTLVASIFLAMLAMIRLEGIGRLCLVLVCLFGALGATQFLRGKSMQLLVVALMLGGAVDIVALILLPVIQADEMIPPPPMADDAAPAANKAPTETEESEPGESVSKPAVKHLSDRVDTTKITLGVAVLVLDAAMLISLAMPGVRGYFEHKRRSNDVGYIMP